MLHLCLRVFFLVFFLVQPAQAMIVDKMVHVSDRNGDYYKVTNDTAIHMFINANVAEKIISRKSISDVKYTAENVSEWQIMVEPARFILAPGESKFVRIKNLCKMDFLNCVGDKDRIFEIALVPSVYVPPGADEDPAVGVLFGFSPIFVLPSLTAEVKYETKKTVVDNAPHIEFDNEGDSLLRLDVDECGNKGVMSSCLSQYYLFPQRIVSIPYTDGKTKIFVVSSNGTYTNEYRF